MGDIIHKASTSRLRLWINTWNPLLMRSNYHYILIVFMSGVSIHLQQEFYKNNIALVTF